jgi:hypothetical protein
MAGYAVSVLAIAQCLNLKREIRHAACKLCILGFQPRKKRGAALDLTRSNIVSATPCPMLLQGLERQRGQR